MRNNKLRTTILLVVICLLAGGGLPYLFAAYSNKLVVLIGFMSLFTAFLVVKKGKIEVYDWLILLFISIPFHDYRIMFGSFFVRMTEVFFVPFMIWAFVQIYMDKKNSGYVKGIYKEYIVLIFFCLFTFMSAILAENIFIPVYRTSVLIYLIMLSVLIPQVIKDREKLYFIIKSIIIVSVLASVFAVFQTFFPVLHPIRPIPLTNIGSLTIFRSGVGWRNPNYFAFYVSLIIPLTFIMKISGYFPEKRFINRCFALQILGVMSSYSRLAVISISLTFLCFLWVRGKKIIAATIFIVLIFLAVAAFLNMEYIYKHNPYLAASVFRIARFEAVRENPLLIAGWRRDAWIANIRMFMDRPLLGVGPFMSTALYAKYKPDDQSYPWDEGLAVHNEFLSLLSERGIIGIGLFMLFMFFILKRAFDFYTRNKDSADGMLMLGLWATVVNFFWFSFGAATIYSVQFWINIGLIFTVYNLKQTESAEKPMFFRENRQINN